MKSIIAFSNVPGQIAGDIIIVLIEVLILLGFLLNLIKKIKTPSSDILYYKKVVKSYIESNVNAKLREQSKDDDMTLYCGTHPDIEDICFV